MRLTDNDWVVLPMVCQGLSDKEIAAELGLCRQAAASRVGRLCRHLGARNRAHAVHLAYTSGLLHKNSVPPRRVKPLVRVIPDPAEVIAARRAVLLGEEA